MMPWVVGGAAVFLLVSFAFLWSWRKRRAVEKLDTAVERVAVTEVKAAELAEDLDDIAEGIQESEEASHALDEAADSLVVEAAAAAAETAAKLAPEDSDGDVPGGTLAKELVP